MSESIISHILAYTLVDANHIIEVLIFVVIVLIVVGCYIIRRNRLISQRNEQLQRILTALDEYRAIVGDQVLPLHVQEELLNAKLPKSMEAQTTQKGEDHSFFVMMDARVNKEKPFADPDFDQEALIKFMGVSREEFCELVPRYEKPERTLDYINSLRAEYAAKLLMEQADRSSDDIVSKCGFRNAAAYNSAFKFSFGITPTEFLRSMSQMFKNK